MSLVTHIEIERLLKQNQQLLTYYLGKSKKQIREYLLTLPEEKRLAALKDLINFSLVHKQEDPEI